MADILQLPTTTDLPAGPAAGLEPLLTIEQLMKWTGYSRSTLQVFRMREENPLPTLGTPGGPRFLPSQVIEWMHEEWARTSAAQ